MKTDKDQAMDFFHGLDDDLILDEKKQTLHTDVMYIDGQKFLVTVCKPLSLTLHVHAEREMQTILARALQGQLELLRSKKDSNRLECILTPRVLSGLLPPSLKI
jgi:hypothetical protein